MIKAATSITLKQQVVAPTLQSHETQHSISTLLANGVNQIVCLPNLKSTSLIVFNMRKTLPRQMDKCDAYTNSVFQPFGAEDDYHDGYDSLTSLRNLHFSQSKMKSSKAIIMLVMVTGVVNLEE